MENLSVLWISYAFYLSSNSGVKKMKSLNHINVLLLNMILLAIVLIAFHVTIGSITLIIISVLIWGIYYFNIYRKKRQSKILNFIWGLMLTIFSASILGVIIMVAMILTELESRVNDYHNIDYAIILGAGLKGDQVSNKLKIRLDAAIAQIKNEDMQIIVSGGQGDDEVIPESQAMYNYLVKNGIDFHRIIQENNSTSTWENIAYSDEIISQVPVNVVIFTSDYHMYRSKLLGKRVGWKVEGYACRNTFTVRLNYIIREIAALAKDLIFDYSN